MKFLFEHEQTRVHLDSWAHGKLTIAASFFWSAGSDLEKSHVGLLRALLYQILDQHPELIQLIFPERWTAVLRSPTQQKPWTEKELLIALKLLSQAPTSSLRLFFLIDGLDEFSGDHQDLIESLHDHGVLTGEELKALGNEIRTRAQGVFLWVTLAIKDLGRGIGKRDSMLVLQKRLANYPSELHGFYQHILDSIDPVYRTFTGRLLLTMLSSSGGTEVVYLSLWMKHGLDSDALHDTRWCPKSGPELHWLMEQGDSCVRNWVGDLINPIPTHIVCASPDSCDCTVDEFMGNSTLSLSHRTVYQFVQQKADDGTLAQMAGPGFDPLLADLYLSLGFSKYCKTIEEFARFVDCNLIGRMSIHPEHFEDTNAMYVKQIAQIALAYDRIGQQITRPLHWTHWTINQLCKNEPRSPLDCQHSTLMSYILSVNPESKDVVGALLELQSHSITAGQRRFLLESALIPCLYIDYDGSEYHHWPQRIVIKLIKTLTDVNEAVQRVKCSFDYSTWQIFLLWLHDHSHWALAMDLEEVDVIEILQAFLSYGADPCAVVSCEDLANPEFDPERSCTLEGDAALISATKLFEHIKKHIQETVYLSTIKEADLATIDCAQRLLADATQCSFQHQ
jgi:hypothetical protein